MTLEPCTLCLRPISPDEDALQVNRDSSRAHRACRAAWDKGYAAGRDEMIKTQIANLPVYLNSDFMPPFGRVLAFTMRMRVNRIEILADQRVIAWVTSMGATGLRAMLDELNAHDWGAR